MEKLIDRKEKKGVDQILAIKIMVEEGRVEDCMQPSWT